MGYYTHTRTHTFTHTKWYGMQDRGNYTGISQVPPFPPSQQLFPPKFPSICPLITNIIPPHFPLAYVYYFPHGSNTHTHTNTHTY